MRNLIVAQESTCQIIDSDLITCIECNVALSEILILSRDGFLYCYSTSEMSLLRNPWFLNIGEDNKKDDSWFSVTIVADTGSIICISNSGNIACISDDPLTRTFSNIVEYEGWLFMSALSYKLNYCLLLLLILLIHSLPFKLF